VAGDSVKRIKVTPSADTIELKADRAHITVSGGFQVALSESGNTLQTVLIQATTNPADPKS
jgi:hypothetical protein